MVKGENKVAVARKGMSEGFREDFFKKIKLKEFPMSFYVFGGIYTAEGTFEILRLNY